MKMLHTLLLSAVAGATVSVLLFTGNDEEISPIVEPSPTPEPRELAYGDLGALNNWPGDSGDLTISEDLTAKNFYIIMDGSRSMYEDACNTDKQKLSIAKAAINQFVDKIPAENNIGLFAFDGRDREERVPLGSNTHEQVKNAVNNIIAGGMTPLSKAVTTARESLTKQAKRQLGYGEYNLVVVTDGQANNRQTLNNTIRSLLQDTPIVVHTIGLCLSATHTLNQPNYMVYKSANNPEMLQQGLQQVLAEAPSFEVEAFK